MHCGDMARAADALRIEALGAPSPLDNVARTLAELHALALPEDVLPALGIPFLARYHAAAMCDSAQCVIGAWRAERLVGFCQVSFRPARVGPVLRANPSAWLPIVRLALSDPLLLWRGARLAAARPAEVAAWPEIAFIAVHPEAQGVGIGKALARAATAEAGRRGCERAFTKTANAVARRLYEAEFAAQVVAALVAARRTYWYVAWNTRPAVGDPHVAS